MKLLFIGNSHTYFNDLPLLVRNYAQKQGISCEITMLAHGGWTLEQHLTNQEASFNIANGNYDYVVLQEHTHPFEPIEKYYKSVRAFHKQIQDSGATTILYMTWAKLDEAEKQEDISSAVYQIAHELGALVAPAGDLWWDIANCPNDALYYQDGAHASPAGSQLAAQCIWNTIYTHRYKTANLAIQKIHKSTDISAEYLQKLRQIVTILRSPEGCPWDQKQTHESLKPCCIEEAAEVICGINILQETGNYENLMEELGDLLLQVFFHAELAKEKGLFDLEDVARSSCEKMIRRHPHVFQDAMHTAGLSWDEIKQQEKVGKVDVSLYLEDAFGESKALIDQAKARKQQKRK